MKKIVLEKPSEEITITDVIQNDIMLRKCLFAYKSEGKSGWCFLARIASCHYGFIAMNYTDTMPRFCGNSMREALQTAIVSREVYVFNGVEELAWAITNKK